MPEQDPRRQERRDALEPARPPGWDANLPRRIIRHADGTIDVDAMERQLAADARQAGPLTGGRRKRRPAWRRLLERLVPWTIGAACAGLFVYGLFLMTSPAGARPVYGANSTAYCLHGTMADGTTTRPGSAASNRHPLGTRLELTGNSRGPDGRRRYVVRDRIGYGSELDLWAASCQDAIRYGRRSVRYRLGWRRPTPQHSEWSPETGTGDYSIPTHRIAR